VLILSSTSALVSVTTGSAGAVSVHASYLDNNAGTITPTGLNTASITGATTTTVVPSPGAGVQRNINTLIILNTSASVANLITVNLNDGTNTNKIYSSTLQPGEMCEFVYGQGWRTFDTSGELKVTAANPVSSYPQVRIVSSGTTDAGPTSMAAGNCLILWNSATAGAKTSTIPTAAGSNNRLTIIDFAQTAQTNAITATPATGAITGNTKVATKGGAQTWVDTSLGWVAEV
jgi:hypothetical protein